MSDTQMVLPTDTVMYQSQEVAAVIADDRYIAADAVEAVEVEYEPMQAVVDPFKSMQSDARYSEPTRKEKPTTIFGTGKPGTKIQPRRLSKTLMLW